MVEKRCILWIDDRRNIGDLKLISFVARTVGINIKEVNQFEFLGSPCIVLTMPHSCSINIKDNRVTLANNFKEPFVCTAICENRVSCVKVKYPHRKLWIDACIHGDEISSVDIDKTIIDDPNLKECIQTRITSNDENPIPFITLFNPMFLEEILFQQGEKVHKKRTLGNKTKQKKKR
jgi:hypothetical protein